mgnify:CR=1 FL=1
MTLKRTMELYEALADEDIYEIIRTFAEDQPDLFTDITYAIEAHLCEEALQEMREETCNGYPMYPELQL